MMAFPTAIETGAGETIASPGLLLGARIFFLLLTVMGLWLTYVGWIAPPTTPSRRKVTENVGVSGTSASAGDHA